MAKILLSILCSLCCWLISSSSYLTLPVFASTCRDLASTLPGSLVRKRLVVQKFHHGLPQVKDLVGLHFAPIEYVWKAIETGEFPIPDENKGRFFILPFQHALTDEQIKSWYNYRHRRSVASFRERHLLAEISQGVERLQILYGGELSLIRVLALSTLLGLMDKSDARTIEDRLFPLTSMPLDRALEEIRECYLGKLCKDRLKATYSFLKNFSISLPSLENALIHALSRKGVILGISRSWVEHNSELVKGDKSGSDANEEDRYVDVGIRVIGGLPIRAIEGIIALGPAEEKMLKDLQQNLGSLP